MKLNICIDRKVSWRASLAGLAWCAGALLVFASALPLAARAAAGSPHIGRDKSRGYLGIEFRDTSDEQVAALHLRGPRGAEVIMVDHDGPAGKAGLQPHDVVLQMDGHSIEAAEQLSKLIRESAPGRVVTLSIVRIGHALTLTAKLANQKELERNAWQQHLLSTGPAPEDDEVANVLIQRYTVETAPVQKQRSQSFIGTVLRTAPYTGASVDVMSPQLAGFFGAAPKTGLLVHEVEANSPASAAGLKAGDVVLRVDAFLVNTTSEWAKRLRAGSGRAVNLTILREKHEMVIMLPANTRSHSLLEWPKIF